MRECCLIAMSRHPAPMVEGRNSKKAAVRIVWRQICLASLVTVRPSWSWGLSRSRMRKKRSRKGSGDVKVRSISRARQTLFSSRMKYFFCMEKRKEDCSMKEERTLKEGLSSCSSLPASITHVTASTTASGALLPTIAWLMMYLSAMLVARYRVSGLYYCK